MKKFYFPALLTVLFAGCNNLEDAELTKRSSFIRFYEGANRYVASEAIETKDGGFLITGTIEIEGDAPARSIWITKTNSLGIKQWESIIPDARVNSVKEIDNGYALVGDGVVVSPIFNSIDDFENTFSRFLVIDQAGNVTADHFFSKISDNKHVDFHTTGLTTDGDGNYITLGTHKKPGQPEMADITALNPLTLDTLWTQSFDYINRNYSNTKALYYNNGRLLWGASITETVNNFTKSYLAIPVIMENSTFVNSNYFGQDKSQLSIKINDLKTRGAGYAAIGSYSETDGSNSNVFFIKIDEFGNFDAESVRYFDGKAGDPSISDPGSSTTEDIGSALATTRDGGYVLAGTSVNLVKGGKDIWLIKVKSNGDFVWSKTIGGRFNEHVTSITETSDGGLAICGTVYDGATEADGLASVFLIKTDANGNLND